MAPDDIYEAIGKLQMVDIALDRQYDEPQAIFESLNSTGMDLKDSDLIRNFILMGLPQADQELVYNNIWRPMEELFSYGNQAGLMNNFFRDYLTMKLGRLVNQGDVYKEFKHYKNDQWTAKPRELCRDLLAFAKHYTDMDSGKSDDAELESLYIDLKAIGLGVAYPFLMKVHEDCANNIIPIETLREVVSICVNYALRRSICGMRTTGLNYMFAVLKNSIKQTDYLNSIKAFFSLQETSKEFPRDKRFVEEFVMQDIYNKKICRFILCKLETWSGHKIVSLDDLSVEHIFPQKPKPAEWGVLQKESLHTIGNLTLAHWADNSVLSNKPFTEKLTIPQGYKQSALRLNEYVVGQSSWSEAQINERAVLLGELAKKVWPYPSLSDAELAPYQKQDDSTPQYTLDSYEQVNAFNSILFEKLNIRILNLGTSVKREFTKLYVTYKANVNIASVVILNKGLRIYVNISSAELIDPKEITRDVTGVGHWGTGDAEVFLGSLNELDDVMAIIEQAFLLQEID